MPEPRTSSQNRETAETRISAELVIDGSGESTIDTGIPFLDHMLTLFARHSLCDLKISAKGDIEVDYHHTVEDVGIVLGSCFKEALGNKHGISRYGWALLPMDETLSRVAIDFGGRPFIAFRAPGRTLAPSSGRSISGVTPAAAHRVGNQSVPLTGSSLTAPASILPGQRIIPGT